MKNPRYPYTHAADYLRMKVQNGEGNLFLSRSEASQLRSVIAKAIGMDDEELAKKLADAYADEGFL